MNTAISTVSDVGRRGDVVGTSVNARVAVTIRIIAPFKNPDLNIWSFSLNADGRFREHHATYIAKMNIRAMYPTPA